MELLIAATMMAILFVGLAAHLRGGIAVWQRTTETTEPLQRQRVALDRLARELANAIVYDKRGEAYGDETGKLILPEFNAHELRWFTVVPSTKQGNASVQMIAYTCSQIGQARGLWRTSRSIAHARARAPEPTPELMLPDCEELSVQYAYLPPGSTGALEWHDEWHHQYDALPQLVEVTLVVAGHHLRRIFALPTGILEPFQAPPP